MVYPQKYGKPDPNTKGSAKDGTWAGLAEEVRYWGDWVLRRVTCKNPGCRAEVPLVRQTWLCKKDKRYVGLKVIAPRGQKRVRFEIVEATSAKGLGFDPGAGSRGGNATCPFCGTVCDAEYVQSQGIAKCTGAQLLAIVCSRPGSIGKISPAESDLSDELLPKEDGILRQMEALCRESDLSVPDEPINPLRPSPNARGLSAVTRHGFTTFGDLFSPRQQLVLLTFAKEIRELGSHIPDPARARAIADSCAVVLDKVASRYSTFSPWDAPYEKIVLVFGKHMLPMVWDYAEAVPLVEGSGGWLTALKDVVQAIQENEGLSRPASCQRGSATELSNSTGTVDAVITDPPYYDNIPYADISDFFYVWLKRSIGHYHPEPFAGRLTPKRAEVTALASRHAGDMDKAKEARHPLRWGQVAHAGGPFPRSEEWKGARRYNSQLCEGQQLNPAK